MPRLHPAGNASTCSRAHTHPVHTSACNTCTHKLSPTLNKPAYRTLTSSCACAPAYSGSLVQEHVALLCNPDQCTAKQATALPSGLKYLLCAFMHYSQHVCSPLAEFKGVLGLNLHECLSQTCPTGLLQSAGCWHPGCVLWCLLGSEA